MLKEKSVAVRSKCFLMTALFYVLTINTFPKQDYISYCCLRKNLI